ncbi:Hpt domain-containing protein [Limnohabitans sp.]|jgi:HPt (histidine-containing phosphotransfer) domain-containing protein|uniref:Hpt domain-containing protein n=1 Tax=Limnohabitans sp. TaxID=1907725 RepID=UPI0037BF1577
MSTAPQPIYLSIERAMEFIGDANGVLSLLKTLQQTLSDDLPRLQAFLDQEDVYSANRILHQLKGFTPVFCVDSLVEKVVLVESLSKHSEAQDLRLAYKELAPQLEALRLEVVAHLILHPPVSNQNA